MPTKKPKSNKRGEWNKKYFTDEERQTARNRTNQECQKRTMTAFTFRYHNINDKPVLDKLNEVENKADYIRQLILKDIGYDD